MREWFFSVQSYSFTFFLSLKIHPNCSVTFLYDLLLNTALLLSKMSVNLVVIYKNYWSYQDKEEKHTDSKNLFC